MTELKPLEQQSTHFGGPSLSHDKIEAVIAVNRAREMHIARRLMDVNTSVNIDDLANDKISMRDILKSATS